jgi:hypothetical protein
MPTTTVSDAVNTTAVDLLSAAHGKGQVAHWFLTANTDRDPAKAVEWIDKAIGDLRSAKDAITTGEPRELRRPAQVTESIESFAERVGVSVFQIGADL